MKIEKNKVVTLSCELRENDKQGEIIDTYSQDEPLKYLAGASNIIEEFEVKVMGLSPGDDFEFTLEASQAFGEYDDDQVMMIPYDTITNANQDKDMKLEVGHPIKLEDEQGNEMFGEVTMIDIEENNVSVDFNHPFAGIPVYFAGKVIEVRDATESEIDHGHAH
jgi:FKBP-type peptidyl-prolyl cis-trans isomerase SlyD